MLCDLGGLLTTMNPDIFAGAFDEKALRCLIRCGHKEVTQS